MPTYGLSQSYYRIISSSQDLMTEGVHNSLAISQLQLLVRLSQHRVMLHRLAAMTQAPAMDCSTTNDNVISTVANDGGQ